MLRDEEESRNSEAAAKESDAAALAAENEQIAALMFGEPDFLKSELKRLLDIEKDIDAML